MSQNFNIATVTVHVHHIEARRKAFSDRIAHEVAGPADDSDPITSLMQCTNPMLMMLGMRTPYFVICDVFDSGSYGEQRAWSRSDRHQSGNLSAIHNYVVPYN